MIHLMVQYSTLIFVTADWNCLCAHPRHKTGQRGGKERERRGYGTVGYKKQM